MDVSFVNSVRSEKKQPQHSVHGLFRSPFNYIHKLKDFILDNSQENIDKVSVKDANSVEYRVLARRYRPKTFDNLIGQSATVRILSNAFDLNRIAHAFLFTGVRGVGKTTAARIVA